MRAFSYLNYFKTLPRKHMMSLLRNELGLQASAGFNSITHPVNTCMHIGQNIKWEAFISFFGEKRKKNK